MNTVGESCVRHEKMTPDQMLAYVKRMDAEYARISESRDQLLEDIKAIQARKEILSWEEIASAVAYPKAASDQERVGLGNPDEYKLLHQAERINKIYRSQMEELFDELENLETQIAKYQCINRCISRLDPVDKEITNLFTRKNLTFTRGAELLHMARGTIYKLQRRAVSNLTEIYNASS